MRGFGVKALCEGALPLRSAPPRSGADPKRAGGGRRSGGRSIEGVYCIVGVGGCGRSMSICMLQAPHTISGSGNSSARSPGLDDAATTTLVEKQASLTGCVVCAGVFPLIKSEPSRGSQRGSFR